MKFQTKALLAAVCTLAGLGQTGMAQAQIRNYECSSAQASFSSKYGDLEIPSENIIVRNTFWGRYTLRLAGVTKPLTIDRYVEVAIANSHDTQPIPIRVNSRTGRKLRAAATLIVRENANAAPIYSSNRQETTGYNGNVRSLLPLGPQSLRRNHRFDLYYEFPIHSGRPTCSYLQLIAP
jgi:hypothetical protein